MAKRRTDQAKKTAKEDSDLDGGFAPGGGFSSASIWSALSQSRYLQLLILLTIAGGLLRFYHLGYNSLWLDEASTLEFARQSLGGIWQSTAGGEFNPPLFYWIEHFMLAFGESESVLRFIPALMGTATIPVIYLAGSALRDRNTGIIAAGLLAFLPTHIYYSQEARAYAPAVFLVTCAVFLYLRAQKSNELVPWLLFAAASALAFWMHFYVILGIGACFLHALIRDRRVVMTDIRRLKGLFAGLLLFIVLTLPLVAVTIGLFLKRTGSSPTFGIQGIDVLVQTFVQLSGFNAAITVAYLLLLCLGIYSLYRADRNIAGFVVIFLVV
ncbi:MAG: phospholipid carrier-dependent glycosyltransferase, partial [Methanobacteriota archaeon]